MNEQNLSKSHPVCLRMQWNLLSYFPHTCFPAFCWMLLKPMIQLCIFDNTVINHRSERKRAIIALHSETLFSMCLHIFLWNCPITRNLVLWSYVIWHASRRQCCQTTQTDLHPICQIQASWNFIIRHLTGCWNDVHVLGDTRYPSIEFITWVSKCIYVNYDIRLHINAITSSDLAGTPLNTGHGWVIAYHRNFALWLPFPNISQTVC